MLLWVFRGYHAAFFCTYRVIFISAFLSTGIALSLQQLNGALQVGGNGSYQLQLRDVTVERLHRRQPTTAHGVFENPQDRQF